jgi:hypothetical protein
MAVRSMETAETAMETDGHGSGGTSRLSRVPEQRLLSPEIRLRWRRRCGTVLGKTSKVLGFSVGRLFIGGGAVSEGRQGGLTTPGRGQELGAPPHGEPSLWPPLWLSFGPCPSSGKNRSFGPCFVQFQEYFLCSFSETQK